MIRVLFLTGAFPPMPCGVGDYTAHLVAALAARQGIEPGVLTSTAAAAASMPPAHFFPIMDHWGLCALPRLLKHLGSFRPDIVHLQYPASFGRVLLPNVLPLLLAGKVPVVQTWHEHPIYTQLVNALPADHLVVVEPCYPEAYRLPYRMAVRHKRTVTCIPIGSNIPRVDLSVGERAEIRGRFGADSARLFVFFGFAHPGKGVEVLFQVLDPARDRLVLLCDLKPEKAYHRRILALATTPPWQGRCFRADYLPPADVAAILAVADAAVFPFLHGVTTRNGSVLAARLQGTPVVATHAEKRGYDPDMHTFWLPAGNPEALRVVLRGNFSRRQGEAPVPSWEEIANRHWELYREVLEAG